MLPNCIVLQFGNMLGVIVHANALEGVITVMEEYQMSHFY